MKKNTSPRPLYNKKGMKNRNKSFIIQLAGVATPASWRRDSPHPRYKDIVGEKNPPPPPV